MRVDVRELSWVSPELSQPKPDTFPTYYPKRYDLTALGEGVKKLGGDNIEFALGYGSTFSGDAAPDSLIDLLAIARNPSDFYDHVINIKGLKLGTLNSSAFHAAWNNRKVNFYSGEIDLDGSSRGMKIGVIGHKEFLKHARGGRPDSMARGEGKGYLYLAGRLHKAVLVPVYTDTNSAEQQQIDHAINQARIDGMWLALGLVPPNFTFEQLAWQYVNLSYAADIRVERANKAQTLLFKNYKCYQEMLGPILDNFKDCGVIRQVDDSSDVFEKDISLPKEVVKNWLKRSAFHAFVVNYFQNIWTYGPLTGLLYGLAKVRRAKDG